MKQVSYFVKRFELQRLGLLFYCNGYRQFNYNDKAFQPILA